jgi:ABC-type transport system substrate-binding protein
MSILSKIASAVKGVAGTVLKIGGSVLSLVPGIGPLAGGALIAASKIIDGVKTVATGVTVLTKNPPKTIDPITAAANNVVAAQSVASNMLSAGTISLTFDGIFTWIKNNLIIVLVGAGVLFFVLNPFRKGRRR